MSWLDGRPRTSQPTSRLLTATVLMLILLMYAVAEPASAHVAQTHRGRHYKIDRPAAALTASWWQKFVSIADPSSLDRCNVGTRRTVFLAGTTGAQSVADRTCSTVKAKTFLVPLINVECSTAEGYGTTFAELRSCAKDSADDFTDLTLVVDGRRISNLKGLRVRAHSTFASVKGNTFGIPPAADSKFASDGYWALIKLTPGTHTVTFGGSYPPGSFTTSVTYHLRVRR